MSAVDTRHFRDILTEERQRVVDAISYLHEETPGSLEENSEQVLKAIDGALQRIAEGTFGICATCGQPISEERLEAIPYATQCIDCRRKGERA